MYSFGIEKGRSVYRAKPNVCNVCRLKEILKNAKGWLSLVFLSHVPKAKHGQYESLSAWSIWSVGSVYFQSLFWCVVCLFSIGDNSSVCEYMCTQVESGW
jgi:hypothetical protein